MCLLMLQDSGSGAAVGASPVGVVATTVCSIVGKEGEQRETPEITLKLVWLTFCLSLLGPPQPSPTDWGA